MLLTLWELYERMKGRKSLDTWIILKNINYYRHGMYLWLLQAAFLARGIDKLKYKVNIVL